LASHDDRSTAEGKVAAGSRVDIARAATAVAVKKGATKPDISTTDAFKRTMLGAASVSFSADGESGLYFKDLIGRLGIVEETKTKLRPIPGGPLVVGPVARGEVEFAVISKQFIRSEPGAELVGPLPADIQHSTVYTAGLSAASSQLDAAAALLRQVVSPAAVTAIASTAVDPVTR
jgi:molybdate transport system substrate-binding protein